MSRNFLRISAAAAICLSVALVGTLGAKTSDKKSSNQATNRKAAVLLVTSDKLAESWQRFAYWKTKIGKPTKIVTISEIDKNYKGADLQEKIRQCVLAHIKSDKTRWVILGGDSKPGGKGEVPDRDTPHNLGRMRFKDIPTDIYYVSEKSWDANGDGIYGDLRNDASEISYTGKAVIGRIPVNTKQQVSDYTDKIIAYESNYPTSKFATNMLYTCAVQMANYKAKMLWDVYLKPHWKAGKCDKFFVNKTPWDKSRPGDYNLTPANWLEKLNSKKYGKMHMHGHGLIYCWQLEGTGRRNRWGRRRPSLVTADTVAKLTNKNAYLAMTTVSCFTGHYDDKKDPCIAESMLRQKDAGAVIVVAPSRYGVPIFDRGRDPRDGKTQDGTTRTMTKFWYYALVKNMTAGEAFAAARKEYAKKSLKHAGWHFIQCEINLLGDPTLDLRAKEVTPADFTFTFEKGKLTVKTDPGLNVCIMKGENIYQVKTADKKGIAQFKVSPRTEGTLYITVSGPSRNTVTKTVAYKS